MQLSKSGWKMIFYFEKFAQMHPTFRNRVFHSGERTPQG